MIEQVPIGKLKPHPENPNHHSKEQIDRLVKLIQYQGWRLPIIVSKQSGYIVSGHGRLAAAEKMKLKEVPVSYQDFLDSDQEYAFLVSDNAIASWAELDLSGINAAIPGLGPDLDVELLGMQNFLLEPADKFINDPLTLDEILPNDLDQEGPQKNLQLVIVLKKKQDLSEILDLLEITKFRTFKDGYLINTRWPQEHD